MRLRSELLAACLILSGCTLFPGLPPFGFEESVVVVENTSDANLVVRFESLDYPIAYAVPAGATGRADLYGSQPASISLLDQDCEVITTADVDGSLTHLRLEADGAGLTLLDGTPPEATRLLIEFYECEAFGADPALLDVDLDGLAGTLLFGGGAGGVWRLDLAGGVLAQVADADPYDVEVALAPAGDRLAITRYDDMAASGVWLVDLGSGEAELVRAEAYEPAWSPDGSRLAMADGDPFGGGLVIVDLASGEVTAIDAPGAAWPSWSPDGSRIAFSVAEAAFDPEEAYTGTVYVVEPGDEPIALDDLPAWGPPAWSPDGSLLAVETYDGFATAFSVIDVASGDTRFSIDVGSAYTAAPSWSPDGTRLAYISSTMLGGSRVSVVSPTGGDSRPLATIEDASLSGPLVWSADGSRLVAAGQGLSDSGLWLLSVEDAPAVQLLSGVAVVHGWR